MAAAAPMPGRYLPAAGQSSPLCDDEDEVGNRHGEERRHPLLQPMHPVLR
jgi:hypothetical protein